MAWDLGVVAAVEPLQPAIQQDAVARSAAALALQAALLAMARSARKAEPRRVAPTVDHRCLEAALMRVPLWVPARSALRAAP